MIKFREHRGSLVESMKTVKEFETYKVFEDWLKEYIRSYINCVVEYNHRNFRIIVKNYGSDERIGWNNLKIISLKVLNDFDDIHGVGGLICWADIPDRTKNYEIVL